MTLSTYLWRKKTTLSDPKIQSSSLANDLIKTIKRANLESRELKVRFLIPKFTSECLKIAEKSHINFGNWSHSIDMSSIQIDTKSLWNQFQHQVLKNGVFHEVFGYFVISFRLKVRFSLKRDWRSSGSSSQLSCGNRMSRFINICKAAFQATSFFKERKKEKPFFKVTKKTANP